MQRDVFSRIELWVLEPADLVFAVAVSAHYAPQNESFVAMLDGVPVQAIELRDAHATRLHRLHSDAGMLVVEYSATVDGQGETATATAVELLTYTRPSRYAESDELSPTAHTELGGIGDPRDVLTAVSRWVGAHLAYVPGSSLPTDGAVRTTLARQGVCRDYAHVCVALLRALGIPARLVSAYAPGLDPMDFHAVAEAWVDGAWRVIDATGLAPRSTLVRIATGRDAADTAFLNVMSGRANLVSMEVRATADALPDEDPAAFVSIS